MIPALTLSGVLPPFIGPSSAEPVLASPYATTMTAIVKRFGTSPERLGIIEGLLNYRQAMRNLGITQGIQWMAGSFVEDVEKNRSRPPADVDVVTFAYRNISDRAAWTALVNANPDVFDPEAAKKAYKADAYYVDLHIPPHVVVHRTNYWAGVFCHQRSSGLWKGILQTTIQCDDDEARKLLR